jgi:pyruvate/2-oxoglutarate dehydrogenase complex dihydrolipoamide acyltransferase (E2) component
VLGQPLTRFERFALDAPVFMKKMLLAAFKNNALMKKKHFGTCGVTSIGTVPHFQGWNIAIGGTYTLQVGVGGITEKPVAIDGNVEIRECLGMDVAVDHDIVDGAPMARFTTRLRELVGNCFGLDDISQG